MQLSQSGKLIKQGQEIQTEDFCLAENWENGSAKYDYVGVLSCDKCEEQVGLNVSLKFQFICYASYSFLLLLTPTETNQNICF